MRIKAALRSGVLTIARPEMTDEEWVAQFVTEP